MTTYLSCPMCGRSFDTAEEPGCAACPLHSGCNLVCCPACGYQTVDPSQSRLARMAASFFSGSSSSKPNVNGDKGLPDKHRPYLSNFFKRRSRGRHLFHDRPLTLLDVPPGYQVRIEGFAPGLSPARRSQLQAYGLVPGYWVEVVQHSPVTVVKIEHSEVAMENDLAVQVWVSGKGTGQPDVE